MNIELIKKKEREKKKQTSFSLKERQRGKGKRGGGVWGTGERVGVREIKWGGEGGRAEMANRMA